MKLYDAARAPDHRRLPIADMTSLVGLDFMKPSRLAAPDDLAQARRWHAKLSTRPTAQA